MTRNKIYSTLAIAILLTSVAASLGLQTVSATHDPDWYIREEGVLTSDTYDFYPYKELSIDFGYSKFGELIYWHPDEYLGTGIQYPGIDEVGTMEQYQGGDSADPFGNEQIDKDLWLNGWFLELRYTHRSERDRKLLAMAMFADMTASGGEWVNGFNLTDQAGNPRDFTDSPYGGRKTTGYAETEEPVVLYDGPRKYVVETVTHIFDWEDDGDGVVDHPIETWAVVDVKLTFIFNKVKKQVIILKDIKQVIDGKELDSPLDIQFSNREEWDLGPYPNYDSYAHVQHQRRPTCYGPEWHMAPGIMREVVWQKTADNIGTGSPVTVEPDIPSPQGEYGWPAVEGSVRVYLNGKFQERGEARDYEIVDYEPLVIELHPRSGPVESEDMVKVIFKVWKYHGESMTDVNDSDGDSSDGVPHLYDVMQIISTDEKYVGWKAYWPVLSDYTPDGWSMWWEPLMWVGENEMSTEPDIPFTIGEWDFMLGKGYPPQFRGVEVVGLTDLHDGSDADMDSVNKLDSEALYQLEEIFNPWDLQKAVHKQTRTWVEWKQVGGGTNYTTNHRPFAYWDDDEWGLYNDADGNKVFSERVYDLTTDELLIRGKDYDVDVVNGYGEITGLISTHKYKIMYHTLPEFEAEGITFDSGTEVTDVLGVTHSARASVDYDVTYNETYDGNWTLSATEDELSGFTETDFKVFIEETHESRKVPYEATFEYTDTDGNWLATVTVFGDWWYWITHSQGVDVNYPTENGTLHVKNYMHELILHIDLSYTQYPEEDSTTSSDVSASFVVAVDEMMGGRWEHTVVGKDAASVDSIGAALVTAAFKNKQVEIGISDTDAEDEAIENSVPWVMRKFGNGYEMTDYHYNHTGGDHRVAFKDDWCHTWQVAGSNVITIGGPAINLASYYFNDFTEAFYGLPQFTPSRWSGAVAAQTCWNKNFYFSGPEKGYAIIGTYHDINGTTGLSIWGVWGRDTYYASRFFHEELIYEFQKFDPCITSVILEIDYTDPEHPTFDIVETLGTISEKGGPLGLGSPERFSGWTEEWAARKFLHDEDNYGDYDYQYSSDLPSIWTIVKGGIHDP